MPRSHRVVRFVRARWGIRTCALWGHGRPVLADVPVRVVSPVSPGTAPAVAAPSTERGVICRRCGIRVGD